jgi:hypothetical protein
LFGEARETCRHLKSSHDTLVDGVGLRVASTRHAQEWATEGHIPACRVSSRQRQWRLQWACMRLAEAALCEEEACWPVMRCTYAGYMFADIVSKTLITSLGCLPHARHTHAYAYAHPHTCSIMERHVNKIGVRIVRQCNLLAPSNSGSTLVQHDVSNNSGSTRPMQ